MTFKSIEEILQISSLHNLLLEELDCDSTVSEALCPVSLPWFDFPYGSLDYGSCPEKLF